MLSLLERGEGMEAEEVDNHVLFKTELRLIKQMLEGISEQINHNENENWIDEERIKSFVDMVSSIKYDLSRSCGLMGLAYLAINIGTPKNLPWSSKFIISILCRILKSDSQKIHSDIKELAREMLEDVLFEEISRQLHLDKILSIR